MSKELPTRMIRIEFSDPVEVPIQLISTNQAKADRARNAMAHYAKLTGEDGDNDAVFKDLIVDMFTDLMHLSDSRQYDFEFLMELARVHHLHETTGGGE